MQALPSLRGRGALWVVGGVAALSVATLLFRFDPMQVDFYPRCPLFVLTGLYCPGCGALRAGHALLHGDLPTALGFNPLLVLLLPVLLYLLAGQVLLTTTGRRLPAPGLSERGGWAMLALLAVYAVLRNLPFAPFTALAP